MKSFENSLLRVAIPLLTVIGGGATLTAAQAQIQFPVAAPSPKVGDIWKTRTIDLWNGKELRTNQAELIAIEKERLVFRTTNAEGANTTFFNSLEGNPCRSMRGADQATCTGSFKFPATVGQKYEFTKLPWTNGLGYIDAKCEVVKEEKITVQAGTFDTIKIECNGFWTRVYEGIGSGGQEEVAWYAPKVNRFVKSYWKNKWQGKINDQQQTELIEFIPAK